MATTTPNFGWTVPTSTDLVKNGATAIETLGDSIDASFVGLKGGTTGQVLSKTSGTDLAFTWVAQDDSNAIQNAIVDAKGDLIAATAADTPARLAVGSNGQILSADSTAATGLKWISAGASALTYTQLATGSLSSVVTTVTGLSGYNFLAIAINGARLNDNSYTASWYLNSDTGANYAVVGYSQKQGSTYQTGGGSNFGASDLPMAQWNSGENIDAIMYISASNSTGKKFIEGNSTTGTGRYYYPNYHGYYSGTSVISAVNFTANASSWSAGTYTIWGAN